MAQQIKTTEILLPRRNEYVRGSVKRENLVRIASALTGTAWPDTLPPIEVRRLTKPELEALAKRGKKAKVYKFGCVDGVHRTTIALATLHSKVRDRFNTMLREKGQEPLPAKLKLDTLPANVVDMNQAESEVEQLRVNLAHGLLLDKKHRDQWVRHLIKNRKYEVPKLAKLLHLTERSVYRMAKGEQTKTGPRKPARPKGETVSDAEVATRSTESGWTPESMLNGLHSWAATLNSPKRVEALHAAIRGNHEKVAKWLDHLVEVLTLTEPAKG